MAAKNKKTAVKNPPTAGNIWYKHGFNPKLIAHIAKVIEGNIEGGQGKQTYNRDTTQPIVTALLEDAELTIESQYSTPFENSNPESRLPNLMGMLQSGQASAALYSVMAAGSDPTGMSELVVDGAERVAEALNVDGVVQDTYSGAQSAIAGLKDRSNFTKLNSRQIYTSSNSIRISGSLVLSAWANAKAEVEDALFLLQSWASPEELSSQSLIVGGLTEGISEGLFPSKIPPLVQLQYAGKTYKPMVIESVSAPITAPMTKSGDRIAVRVQITFLSLTAWDKNDIAKIGR